MPVHASKKSRQLGTSSGGVTRHETEKAAIKAVLSNCDILLTWGVSGLSRKLAAFEGAVVAISHGSAPWVDFTPTGTRREDSLSVSNRHEPPATMASSFHGRNR